jgi:hypothetical protein
MYNYREKTASCAEEDLSLENMISYKIHLQIVEKSPKKLWTNLK